MTDQAFFHDPKSVSINQFISTAVTEKVSALLTEDYIAERAERASRSHFEWALAQVPNQEPDEWDRL